MAMSCADRGKKKKKKTTLTPPMAAGYFLRCYVPRRNYHPFFVSFDIFLECFFLFFFFFFSFLPGGGGIRSSSTALPKQQSF
jgi:hypothetical protein